jgi:AraC family transcriptional regulator of adaptative response/methylated-DNA-[protein]-cysteine methyltransferase
MNQLNANLKIADNQWNAVLQRDAMAVGQFVYAVRTTGIYCRPDCPSRRPNRRNVQFFSNSAAAQAAGFRACKRCQPNQAADRTAELLTQACRFIERADPTSNLADLAEHVGLSPHYLHRLFRKRLGITPKQYSAAQRAERLKSRLALGESVTQAIYGAGFGASGRCYAQAPNILGMTPKQYRDQGKNTRVRIATAACSLGRVLVAVTAKGICQIAIGDDDAALETELLSLLPAAEEVMPDEEFAGLLAAVVSLIDSPTNDVALPLDIRGTVFQQKVWLALRAIPPGETHSYSEVARAVGRPDAVRAVASACAANTIAVAVPCHRVVRNDGTLGGYRWGIERKRSLLERESRRDIAPHARHRKNLG